MCKPCPKKEYIFLFFWNSQKNMKERNLEVMLEMCLWWSRKNMKEKSKLQVD